MASFCSTCQISFNSPEEMREHFKSDWHVYNSRRRLANLLPISKEIWDTKMWQMLNQPNTITKGQAHKKGGKQESKESREPKEPKVYVPRMWKLGDSLFDGRRFTTVEKSLTYMRNQYSLVLPDPEYLVDRDGLLAFLEQKIEENHQCIYCNRVFQSGDACRKHMIDKGHCRIGTDTDELMADIEDFYDFRTSIQEIKIKSKMKNKLKNIMDEDKQLQIGDQNDAENVDEDSENDSWTDVGSNSDLASCSDLQVLECDDVNEFQDVMEKLGLRPARITDDGDLMLPDGSVAVNREMAWIYRQRFRRTAAQSKTLAKSQLHQKAKMLTQGAHGPMVATGVCKTTRRQVVAVLRDRQYQVNKLAVYGAMKGPKFKRRMDQNMPHFMKG